MEESTFWTSSIQVKLITSGEFVKGTGDYKLEYLRGEPTAAENKKKKGVFFCRFA